MEMLDVAVEIRTDDEVVLHEPALKLSPVITAFPFQILPGGRIDRSLSLHPFKKSICKFLPWKSRCIVTS
jgi:hypothetical protein